MRLEGSGSGISGVHHRKRRDKNGKGKGTSGARMENPGVSDGSTILSGIRQFLSTRHPELLPASSTPDRTNIERKERGFGLEPGSADSLRRTQAMVHHGPDSSTL